MESDGGQADVCDDGISSDVRVVIRYLAGPSEPPRALTETIIGVAIGAAAAPSAQSPGPSALRS